MILEDIMRNDVFTLTKDDSIASAIMLMEEKKIRHLPIVDECNHLVGLVTDRDIRDATPSILFETEKYKKLLENPLKKIMKTNIYTGHPLDFVEEVSALFYEHRIGCLPILQDNTLIGIVTETDVLRTFVELTGANQPGSQIEVKVPNKSGMLYEITTVIRSRKANIQSVLVYPDKTDENYKIIVIRVQMMNPLSIVKDLQAAGHQVLWPNNPGQSS